MDTETTSLEEFEKLLDAYGAYCFQGLWEAAFSIRRKIIDEWLCAASPDKAGLHRFMVRRLTELAAEKDGITVEDLQRQRAREWVSQNMNGA